MAPTIEEKKAVINTKMFETPPWGCPDLNDSNHAIYAESGIVTMPTSTAAPNTVNIE
jgi:hypothetical protein